MPQSSEGPGSPSRVGPYRVEGELGRGGMGVVYRARNLNDGTWVALKMVMGAEEVGSLRREIATLARLHHPGVVRVYDHGLSEGLPWQAMELLEGETLDSVMDRDGAWSRTMTGDHPLAVIRRLCGALAYCHGEGVVHRDLKPENVMVRPGGEPALFDFGMVAECGGAAWRERLDLDASAGGTLQYMAPEQARGDRVDARADLYSLGCILYQILAGRLPFLADRSGELLQMHASEVPVPPSHHRSGHPAELDELVLRLLAKEPKDRPGYARDVARILGRHGVPGGEGGPLPRPYLYRPGYSGRADLDEILRKRLGVLRKGAGGIVLLRGESGVGKTRISQELAQEAQARGFQVFGASCLPPERAGGAAMQGFLPILRSVADMCRSRGRRGVESLLGDRGQWLGLVEPSFLALEGVSDLPPLPELPEDEGRTRLLDSVRETLRTIAARRPSLVVLDDLQWSDELTLDLVAEVARGEAVPRLMILATIRTGPEADLVMRRLPAGPTVTVVDVAALSRPAVSELIGGMLAMSEPPSPLVEALHRHSEGNALFVAEYLRAAVTGDLLRRDEEGRWIPGRAGVEEWGALRIPGTIHDLLVERLHGLDRTAVVVAELAAALGRETPVDLLLSAARHLHSEDLTALSQLVARHVVEELAPGMFRFTHDKVREVIYEGIEPHRIPEIHEGCARALEELSLLERATRWGELGHHWERAGDSSRALDAFETGADRALKSHALSDAERLYRSALTHAETRPERAVWLRLKLASRVLHPQGGSEEAEELLMRGLSEAQALADDDAMRDVEAALGHLHRDRGRPERSRECFARALAIARRTSRGVAERLHDLARLELREGRPSRARPLLEEGMGLSESEGDRRLSVTIRGTLGQVLAEEGETPAALSCLEEALRGARELGNEALEAELLSELAFLASQRGEWDRAREQYEEALAGYRRMGRRRYEARTLANLAALALDEGRVDESLAPIGKALDIARQLGDPHVQSHALTLLASIVGEKGDITLAMDLLGLSRVLHRGLGELTDEVADLVNLAEYTRELGLIEQTWEIYRIAMPLARETSDPRIVTIIEAAMGRLHRLVGESAAARELLRRSERRFRDSDAPLDALICLCEQGYVCLAEGEDAGEILDAARRLAAELGLDDTSLHGRGVVGLALSCDAAARGEKLLAGEVPEHLPPRLRERLDRSEK